MDFRVPSSSSSLSVSPPRSEDKVINDGFNDARLRSTSPPPAPGPYTPATAAASPRAPLSDGGESGLGCELQSRYEALQRDLQAKFDRVQAEYHQLEAHLRAEYREKEANLQSALREQEAASRKAMEERERVWNAKEEDLKQVHRALEVQNSLMQEQLQATHMREKEVEARERELAARPGRREEVSLSALEQKLRDKERAIEEREVTVVRLERQMKGMQRLRQAVMHDVGVSVHPNCADKGEQATPEHESISTSCDGDTPLRSLVSREKAAEDKECHANALWASAKRREGMLREWEATLRQRETSMASMGAEEARQRSHIEQLEQAVAQREREVVRCERRSHEVASEQRAAAVALKKAAEACLTRLSEMNEERLVRCLHARERRTLLRTTTVSDDEMKDRVATLAALEKELEEMRESMHRKAESVNLIVAQALESNSRQMSPTRGVDPHSHHEADLRARENVVSDKEARWHSFLARETSDHRSLEAQRFGIAEQLLEVDRRMAALRDKEGALAAEAQRIRDREVAAKRMEEEAARVLGRLEEMHSLRKAVEARVLDAEVKEAHVKKMEQSLDDEAKRLCRRWDVLRAKEKRLEKCL
eukprot:Sspe_Gene.67699::Locus_39946_Transcript_1_1_Confidence_1.000_Length_1843::g.67699::m.67699